MCGINGIIHFDTPGFALEPVVQAMNDAIQYRGPDDQGIFLSSNGRVALGHRRLSILDLSDSGHQPMSHENSTIVFNGEIYNFEQLRKELSEKSISSSGDTEVLLHCLHEQGSSALTKLQGMFAFALWDEREARLTLVRDRLGVKPLYYTQTSQFLAFSSEIRALLEIPQVNKDANPESIVNYLAANRQSGNNTIYSHIKKIPPAHKLTVSLDGTVSQASYWDISLAPKRRASSAENHSELLSILERSVEKRLVSDVPVGCFLSGGVDSSAVLALMRKVTDRPLYTYSVGFENAERYDERQFARQIAEQFSAEHHEIVINKADIRAMLPQMVEIFDDPLSDPTSIPLYFLSKKAAEDGTKVILTGDGADELFFGYRGWYRYHKYRGLFATLSRVPRFAKGLYRALSWLNINEPAVKELLIRCAHRQPYFIPGSGGLRHETRRQLLTDEFQSLAQGDARLNALQSLEVDFLSAQGDVDNIVDWMCYTGIRDIHPNYFLHRADKISSRHSIEVRVPFLDPELVQFAFSLPASEKLGSGEPKAILKRALAGILPDSILYRPKMGFCVPVDEWLLDIVAEQTLTAVAQSNQILPLFNEHKLKTYIDQFIQGKGGEGSELWNIYFLTQWIVRWQASNNG